MVAAAKRKGLDGLALTDHNTCDGCRDLMDLGLLRSDGLPVDGFLVIPGEEITTADGHLLCLGVMPPALKGRPAPEVSQIVHALGGFVIPPHPYDLFRSGIRESVLNRMEMDAVEVFNAATTLRRFNEAARAYARTRGLPGTAGSDAHDQSAVGTAYTLVAASEFSLQGVLAQIRQGTHLQEQYLSMRANLRKTWGNWKRLQTRRMHAQPGGRIG